MTEQEVSEEITISWYPVEKALQLVIDDNPDDYMCKFIRRRNIAVLAEVIALSHGTQAKDNE